MVPEEAINREEIYKCPKCGARIKDQSAKLNWGFSVVLLIPLFIQHLISNAVLRLSVVSIGVVGFIYLT